MTPVVVLQILYIDSFGGGGFGWFGGGDQTNWFLGVSPEGFGTIAMMLNFAVSILVSNFTKEPPNEIKKLVENLRTPDE